MTAAGWAATTLSAVLALISLTGCLALHRRHEELKKLVLGMMADPDDSDDLPTPGYSVEPFVATTTAGGPVDETAFAGSTVLVGLFLVGCSMCHGELAPFRGLARGSLGHDRTLAVVLNATPGNGYVGELEPVADVIADERAAAVATAVGVIGYPAFCLLRDGVVVAAAHSVDGLEQQATPAVTAA